jgi:hypothetical protein
MSQASPQLRCPPAKAELPCPIGIGFGDGLEHKTQRTLKVLVACEYSGVVRDAFIAKGHHAISCDLLPTESGGKPHIIGDVRQHLAGYWDLMIAHPPCTYLCNSGVRWLYNQDGSHNETRWQQMLDACEFFNLMLRAPIKHIAVENPIMHKHARERLSKIHSQIVQPWQFGHGETKATCLWLKNLPKLEPTNIVEGREGKVWKMPPSPDRWKARSRTYTGIAEAMADQWTLALCSNCDINKGKTMRAKMQVDQVTV